MNTRIAHFPLPEAPELWKLRLLQWLSQFTHSMLLDNCRQDLPPEKDRSADWECMAATHAEQVLEAAAGTAFEQLLQLRRAHEGPLFGFLGYDLKNETEALQSNNPDGIGLPDMGFFLPRTCVTLLREGRVRIDASDPEAIWRDINRAALPEQYLTTSIALHARIPKAEYLRTVEAVRGRIAAGDIYEMNFCQEFFAENATLNPVALYAALNAIGKAPFSAFMRWGDKYLVCASPERFLQKTGDTLLTQPIKGTRRRGATAVEDEAIRQELSHSEKDRSENVMIVDLVRNDLSHHCLPGSVQVEELCHIYTFATVHQMISTISGRLEDSADPNVYVPALRDCFPMGSMTGAPKVMAMALIEEYERTRRGLYSGAVGFFSPEGDFDFNVVIRSVLYNAATGYVSAQVGGAIVYDSVPEEEYEECLVKIAAVQKALSGR